MSSDTFSAALPLLRPHTSVPVPYIYTHLAHLLTRYSSGLSLPITLDTLPATAPCPEPSYLELTVTKTHAHPRIYLLKSLNTRNTKTAHPPRQAFLPPSSLPPLPIGTILRLPVTPSNSDALRLAELIFPSVEITSAHLPSLSAVIQLPFPHNLPHPHTTYTLQNIWNQRDLTPPAVYAMLQQVHGNRITLSDGPSSPPVEMTLLPAREGVLHSLPVPCTLLVTAPLVTPSDDSFALHDTPSSVFFFEPHPFKKRPRVDSSHEKLHTPAHLVERDIQDRGEITVHARVKSVDNLGENSDISVVLAPGNVAVDFPCGAYQPGDEVLLTGVNFRKRWRAEQVMNVSTMQGLLHCPFLVRFIPVSQAVALCSLQGEGESYLTAFVRVRLRGVMRRGDVRLSVVDYLDDGKSEGGSGVVRLRQRGFHQIFGASKRSFWALDEERVRELVDGLRDIVWLMVVCCGDGEYPVLTACLRGS